MKRININKKVRKFIKNRDQNCCVYCLSSNGPFEIDHVHPVSLGGTNILSNLVLACRSCNRSKWAHSVEIFAVRLENKGTDIAANILERVKFHCSLSF